MKWLIAIVLIVGFVWGGYQIYDYEQSFEKRKPAEQPHVVEVDSGNQLSGLPPELEASLAQAKRLGAKALGQWIEHNKKKAQDPRLGWIELDYVVLVAPLDIARARSVFKEVKQRTDPASPVMVRIKQLEKTYE